MTTTTVVLEPPPAKFLNANDRLHYRPKAELTKAWREAACAAVNNLFEPYHYERAHITFAIRFETNRRRDVGNYFPTAKACVDGLVDSNLLLLDDDDTHLLGPDLRREYPNGTPRVTITIQEIQ